MTMATTTILESINPANGELVGSVQITPTEQIPELVEKSREAQKAWNQLGLEGRIKLMQPISKRLAEEASRIGNLITAEMGKSHLEAQGESSYGAKKFELEIKSSYEAFLPEEISDLVCNPVNNLITYLSKLTDSLSKLTLSGDNTKAITDAQTSTNTLLKQVGCKE